MSDRPPCKFTVRHVGRSTIQEIEMTYAPERIWAFAASGAAWADGLGMWSPEDEPDSVEYLRADLARSPADLRAVPEVAALLGAAEWAFPILKTYLKQSCDYADLESYRATLDRFTKEPKA
jgi:hypothetical protein